MNSIYSIYLCSMAMHQLLIAYKTLTKQQLLIPKIFQKEKMGQTNLQKIKQSILDLTQSNRINREEAQNFIKDYINSGENIKDVNYFIEHQSIDLFLKHFINVVYPTGEEQLGAISQVGVVESKSDVRLAGKIVEAGCMEIMEKFNMLVQDIRDLYLCQEAEITTVRQKIKNIIVSRLEIESYRFFHYNQQHMKQTNSKILYSFDTQHKSLIYKYAKQRHTIQKQKRTQKLQEVTKQAYQDYQTFVFEFEDITGLYIVILQINYSKWRYQKSYDQISMKKMLYNIFCTLYKELFVIFDLEAKIDCCKAKNVFSQFTLVFLEVFLQLQTHRIQKSIQELKLQEDRKKNCGFHRIEEINKKCLNKIRQWQRYFQEQRKIMILEYNYERDLQFVFINGQEIIDFKKYAQNIINLEECCDYFFGNKKYIKKLNKLLQRNNINETITLQQGISANLHQNQSSIQNKKLTLFFQLEKIDKMQDIQRGDVVILRRSSNKQAQKRTKTSVLNIGENGWFKFFIKEETENLCIDSANNGLKLPKLNRKFRLSNFKHLYSLEQLRQEININNQNINFLEFNSAKLETFTIKVFSSLPFFKNLPHEGDQFPNFIRETHLNYEKYDNKFHNFKHGVNVMHMCYLISCCKKNQELLSDFDKFIIIMSGLCHDIGHTGYTNQFQIAKQSEIALTYNNKSPLENYHASQTFQLLRKPENNFLNSLNQKQFRYFRQLLISSILYTDVKEHFNLLKHFESKKKSIRYNDITILAGMIVHSSDFAGSVKSFEVCKAWSLLVNQEFTNQFNQQGKLGLPQTPFMKDLGNLTVLSKNQCGFLKVIVVPLLKQLSEFYDDKMLTKIMKNTENNIKQWQKLGIQQEKLRKAHQIQQQ